MPIYIPNTATRWLVLNRMISMSCVCLELGHIYSFALFKTFSCTKVLIRERMCNMSKEMKHLNN